MRAGCRAAVVPAAGRRRAGRGVRRGGERQAGTPAEGAVRAVGMVAVQGRPGHPREGRQSLYSVPWKHLGKTLDARSTATMVQLFCGGELVKTHVRKPRGKQTDLGDYPPVMWNVRPRQAVALFSWVPSPTAEVRPAARAESAAAEARQRRRQADGARTRRVLACSRAVQAACRAFPGRRRRRLSRRR